MPVSSRADEEPTAPEKHVHWHLAKFEILRLITSEIVSVHSHLRLFISKNTVETSDDDQGIGKDVFHTECMYRASRDAHLCKTSAQTEERVHILTATS